MQWSRERRWLKRVLLLVVVAVNYTALAWAEVPAKRLEDLQALFAKNPVIAWEKAYRLFQEPRRKNDLQGMMQVLQLLRPRAMQRGALVDEMAVAAAQCPSAAGNWIVLGDLYIIRARAARSNSINGVAGAFSGDLHRLSYLAEQSLKCYEKAGQECPEGKDLQEYVAAKLAELKTKGAAATSGAPAWDTKCLGQLAEPYQNLIKSAAEGKRTGEDRVAVQAVLTALQSALNDGGLTSTQIKALLNLSLCYVHLRYGASLIKPFRALWGRLPAGENYREILGKYHQICLDGWSGFDDLYLDQFFQVLADPQCDLEVFSWACHVFAGRARTFKRYSEVPRLIRHALNLAYSEKEPKDGVSNIFGWMAGSPDLTPDLRAPLLSYCLQYNARAGRTDKVLSYVQPFAFSERDQALSGLTPEMKRLLLATRKLESYYSPKPSASPPNPRSGAGPLSTAQLFWANALVEGAFAFPVDKRPDLLGAATVLYEKAGRADLAEKAKALFEAFAKGDPKVLLQGHLMMARSAASGGRWEEAVTLLEPQCKPGASDPGKTLLDGLLLLQQAKLNLGKAGEAEACLVQVRTVIGQAGLTAGERADYLLTLAPLTSDLSQRVQVLLQAEKAAGEAGFDWMQEKINVQLVELTQQTGDLAAAKRALLDLVKAQEAKRDRLAFDPLLRQQWFVDTLSPYRNLLTVAAKQEDASLALGCAEKMRSRALADQLAWRKVDMSVKLPKALRKRFEDLKEKRKATYALLQQATGVPTSGDESDETRGVYIPIRGVYMPIRGPLEDSDKGGVDRVKLKSALEELAKEESALESAIREAVPAYRNASQAQIPEGNQLVQWARLLQGTAVLEYTLCDSGVVVTAIAPGFQPSVKLLPVKKEELRNHLTQFRQLLLERSDKLEPEARSLYKLLLTPVESILGNSRRLLIVADGALQLIPFAALQSEDGKYLAEKYAISYTPSLTLALSQRTDTADRRQETSPATRSLIVAAPDTGMRTEPATEDPGGTTDNAATTTDRGVYMPIRGAYMPIRGVYIPIRGEGGTSGILSSMALIPLPGAKAEGEAVARQLANSLLLTGEQATKERLLKEGGQCEILHIATHGYADPEVPEFSGLLLASEDESNPYEVLTAQEVYLWPLRAKVVTLSACQTGLGKDVEGEGVLGLTRAFLYAGAKEVVCSLWSVSDESTSKLMQQMYAGMQKGMPVETAMQAAQLTLLKDPKTSHPFYWAAFVDVKGPR